MKEKFLFLLVGVALAVVPATAQQQEKPGEIAILYMVKPKPGMSQQFTEGGKRHVEWHKQNKDTWTWHAWEIITGENLGNIVWRSGGHHWKDFDSAAEFRADDDADAEANIVPNSAGVTSWFTRTHLDLTHWPDTDVPAMIVVTEYRVRPGAESDWLYAVRKFHEALQKTKAPFNYSIAQTVSGGEVPTFVIVGPRANWAAMEPPEKSFVAYVEEVYGRQETQELLDKFNKTLRGVSTNVARHRADLSYTPPAM